jgi:hypothetical protein
VLDAELFVMLASSHGAHQYLDAVDIRFGFAIAGIERANRNADRMQ